MLLNKEKRLCKFLIKKYSKKLGIYLRSNTKLDADKIIQEYNNRFYKYINEVDMGENRCKFTSYLNIYSGLAAYEILREKGLKEEEAVKAYDMMCASMRKLVSYMFKFTDMLPNGYNLVKKSMLDDLKGQKAICWETKILQDDNNSFTYEISNCLYFNTCKEHGYPEFCKVFCNHDLHAYGVLKKHAKFIRKSTIAEDGTCCHDTIKKVK